jgi:hypothetical protein
LRTEIRKGRGAGGLLRGENGECGKDSLEIVRFEELYGSQVSIRICSGMSMGITSETKSLCLLCLYLHARAYFLHLIGNLLGVICSYPLETDPGLLMPPLFGQPSRALFDCEHPEAK